MIKEKIYEFLKLNETNPIPEDIINQFRNSIEWGLKRQLFSERKDGSLRLSIAGKCPRQTYYSITMPELARPLEPRVKLTFLFGDVSEAIIVAMIKACEIDLHDEQKEVEFEGVKGHIDGIVTIDGKDYLLEIKSMADGSFKATSASGMSNDFGYLSQVNCYLEALNLNKAIFICLNKNTGHLEEVIVDKDNNIIKEARENIKKVREAEASGKLPERKFTFEKELYRNKPTGKEKLPFQCSYCSFVDECWKGQVELEFKNNKPVYYKK